ncbi:MAG: methylamine dehydrogenase [Rhizobium sp.]|nr:MAG: methylamine dehydrogenase [Rhizobium sp.]
MVDWRTGLISGLIWIGAAAQAQAPDPSAAVPEVEESSVAVLPAMGPHWVMAMDAWGAGTRIFNGDTGKIVGMLHTISLSNIAFDPQGRYFFVAETIWTKGNRGTRQDMLTLYDAKTLKLVTEISLPGRLLTGNRKQNLSISADGRYAYIYDMSPASSIIVVDIAKRKAQRSAEIPGCGLVFAGPAGSVASLCGDGSLAVAKMKGAKMSVDQTAPFFKADDDPVFDNSIVDPETGKGIFLSYSGLIYGVTFGAGETKVEAPWSLQEAAKMEPGSTAPLKLSWLPGGRQQLAYHKATGRLYVLMHMGEFWSHKMAGTELWVVDTNARKVIARRTLADPVGYVAISQDASPLLYLGSESGLQILDATNFEEKHKAEGIGAGTLVTPDL